MALAWPLGSLCCIGLVSLSNYSWHLCLAAPAIPSFVGLVALSLLPESPRWLLSAGYQEEGKNVINAILQHRTLDGKNTSCALSEGIHVETPHIPASTDMSIVQIFKPPLLQFTLITSSMCMAASTFSNGLYYWGPKILAGATGHRSVSLSIFAYGEVVNVITTLGTLVVIEVTGRRYLAMGGFAAGIALPIMLASRPSLEVGITIWLALQMQQTVLWIGAGLYTAEVYSSECRGRGVGFAGMCGGICGGAAPIIVGALINRSVVSVLTLAAFSAVVGFLASIMIPWDTTGHLDDMSMETAPLLPAYTSFEEKKC